MSNYPKHFFCRIYLRKRCSLIFRINLYFFDSFVVTFSNFIETYYMSKVNLKKLSESLNVSISTVSKALRGSYEIGSDTKKRVIEMAQQMGYSPNPYAGSMRNNKSKTIALLVPELANNFFIQAISGAESIAQEKDYHILIYNTHDDFAKEESIPNTCRMAG